MHASRLLLLFFGVALLLTPSVQSQNASPWTIRADERPERYAPITLANGIYGMTFSEHAFTDNFVRLSGIYDTVPSRGMESSAAAIDFTPLDVMVADLADLETEPADFLKGRSLGSADPNDVTEWSQELNLQEGWLKTRFVFEGLELEHQAFALKHMLHTAVIKVTVTARESRALFVKNRPQLDAQHTYLNSQYLHQLRDRKIPLMTASATSSGGQHTLATTSSLFFEDDTQAPSLQFVDDGLMRPYLGFQLGLAAGESFTFYLIGSMATSKDYADPVSETARLNIFAYLQHPASLIERHQDAWATFWDARDIIVSNRPDITQGLRLALFMLDGFVNKHTTNSAAAMGLGTDYWGWKVLWDSDFWIYPAILLTNPDAARAMLEYRFERLGMARRNAAAHGYAGAMFPWESGARGDEQTPLLYLTGPYQHHVTAVVGLAFWRYYCVSQDRQWLADRGYPVLKDVADFWVSRADETAPGQFEIINVVGSDEHAVNVDNDAFTNGVAQEVLHAATQAARLLSETPNPMWQTVADDLVLLSFPDGTTREHATYDGEIIKQADVNLLSFPLDVITDPSTTRKNLAYYDAKLDPNGPNMSRFMYAGAAARMGDAAQAAVFFDAAYLPYVRPPFNSLSLRETSQGNTYFGTSAGGMLQAVILGFGGFHFTADGLVQHETLLPEGWGSIQLKGIGGTTNVTIED